MRFSRLTLARYGHFENCELSFPRGEADFHLIFGPNEAGKSTTMSAVNDLLFGFPTARTYHFRFDAALLRVGAVLETAGGRLDLRRRRGNKDTLLDAADVPLPEAPLRAALCGLSGDDFRQKFSLDHARLRDGGRAIVDARDDVGQALFAAGSGVLGAQSLLLRLQAEADAVWGERRAQGKSYWQAEKQLTDAEARLKAALVRPKAWRDARDHLHALIAGQRGLEEQRSAHQDGLQRLQRIRRLAAPAQQRRSLHETLDAAADTSRDAPLFNAGHEAVYEQALRTMGDAEPKLLAAEAAIVEAEAARGAIHPDRRLVDRRDDVTRLVAAAGAAGKAASDLVGVEQEMRELEQQADGLAREIGLRAAPARTLLAGLPPRPMLAALRDRAASLAALQVKLVEARDQRQRSVHAAEATAAELARLGEVPDRREMEAAVREARTADAVVGRLRERRHATMEAESALSTALKRLSPWQGNAEALAALVPPADEAVRQVEAGLGALDRALADDALAERSAAESLARLELDAAQLAASRLAIPAADIDAARQRRERAWAGLREILARGGEPVLPMVLDGYAAHVLTADRLADQRFDTAEASARLAVLAVEAAQLRLGLRQARERQERAALERAGLERDWTARMAACGLPALMPAAARQWAANRLTAIQAAERLAGARQAEACDLAQVAEATERLRAVDADAVPAGARFSALLDRVELQVKAAETLARQRSVAEAELRTATTALARASSRLSEFEERLVAEGAAWSAAVASSGLAMTPDTLPTLLPLFEQLRSVLEAADRQQRRIAGIARDQEHFLADALGLASACGALSPDLDPHAIAEQLRLRLQQALEDDRAAREQDAALQRWRGERDEARRSIGASEALLAPLLALGNLPDRTTLAQAIERARAWRATQAELRALDQRILSEGDGYSLDALLDEVASADLPVLGALAEQARANIAELDGQIATAAQAVGRAQHAFDALDHGADAALAAADEQQARAAMAAEAETYLLKRAQAVMLKWAVDEYRQRQESPLLNRASQLFSRLTLGRYHRLDIDRTSEKPRLVGECSDGRSLITLDGMSDGTADQLFLALRLAALEQSLEAGMVLPFLADDLFINFDDRRAHAGFQVLGEIARRTQVLFFTHHQHLRAIAEDAIGAHAVSACELA